MHKIKNNLCPKNTTCPDVKTCHANLVEELGYGLPGPLVEDGKCRCCEKCTSEALKSCSL